MNTIAKAPNAAQRLLIAIGGTAELVAGRDGHYYADNQTTKKVRSRSRIGRGTFGRNLLADFAAKWLKKQK